MHHTHHPLIHKTTNMMKKEETHVLWLFIVTSLMLVSETVGKVPAIIVFGDSSVDAGNNNFIPTMARSNFVPYGRDFPGELPTGRFSNGRIPTDFISQFLGLKSVVPAYLDPDYSIYDFATGVTFASAGSGYDNATSDVLGVIPLWKELEYYKEYQKNLTVHLGAAKAKNIISNAVYMTSLGTNDFLENYYNENLPDRQAHFTIDKYQDFLIGIARNFFKSLYALGARKISVGGLPPMGCLPLERATNMREGSECRENYNKLAIQFNAKLNNMVNSLNKELVRAKLVFANPYNIFMRIVNKPSVYGFESTAVACCSTGRFEMGYACSARNPFTCSDASKYVFWDAFHPTERTSLIIADNIVKHVLNVFIEKYKY